MSPNKPYQTEKVAVFIFLSAIWIYAGVWVILGFPIYRDQHLGTAIKYANEGVDLLRPVIVGFNATGTGTPQEFPFWQALAGLALRLMGGWWGAATIVSLLLFSLSLPFFWKAAKEDSDAKTAWIALLFLLSQPLVFHLAGGAQTDGLSLGLLFFFFYSSESLRTKPSYRIFFVCLLASCLLALTKLPYLMVGGGAAILRLLLLRRATVSQWVFLSASGAIALTIFWLWNHWCDHEIGRAVFRYRPLTFREIPDWFLGSWEYRLNPLNYLKASWRALACLWGSFILVGLTVYGLWKNPRSLGACLLYGALLTTMVFTKLVLIHRHYYLMYAPGVALLNAAALFALFPYPKKLIPLILAPLLLLSLAQGLIDIEVVATGDPHMKNMGTIIAQNTSEKEKLLILGGGWGGDAFLHSGRNGLSVDDTALPENHDSCRSLKALGYTKFIWIAESPLLHALQITNPGGSGRTRERFPVKPAPQTFSWHTIFGSNEIVIKELP